MDRLSADTNPDPHAKALRIAALETDFLATFPEACEADDALAAATGHPVLAEGSRWRDLARESGAPEAARKADELVAHLLDDEARRWRESHGEGHGEPDPGRAFRDLADLRAFDLEALARRSGTPPLRDDRPVYRERFPERDPRAGADHQAAARLGHRTSRSRQRDEDERRRDEGRSRAGVPGARARRSRVARAQRRAEGAGEGRAC